MTGPGADELRARAYLRALDARPIGHTHHTPRGTTMTAPDPDEEPRWWSTGKEPPANNQQPSHEEPPPSWHITFTPPPTPTPPPVARDHDRQARARRWLLTHGAAAGTGWTFGLYHSMAAFLNTLGPGGPAAGLALAGFSWFAAEVVGERYVRILPSRTRPPVLWALRIPMSTALLATALHAPNALL